MSQWILLWLNPQLLSSAMCKEVRAKRVADLSLPLGRDQTFITLCGAPIGNMHPAHSVDGAVVVIYVMLQAAEPALQPAAPHPFVSSMLLPSKLTRVLDKQDVQDNLLPSCK